MSTLAERIRLARAADQARLDSIGLPRRGTVNRRVTTWLTIGPDGHEFAYPTDVPPAAGVLVDSLPAGGAHDVTGAAALGKIPGLGHHHALSVGPHASAESPGRIPADRARDT